VARCGSSKDRDRVLEALGRLPWGDMSRDRKLGLLRAYGLVLCRLGPMDGATAGTLIDRLGAWLPEKDVDLNRELVRVLVALDDPAVVAKTVDLMRTAATQEEQIHYAYCLRVARPGWTPALREAYFQWFVDAATLYGGNSFTGYLKNIREEAIEHLNPAERAALAEVLARQPGTGDPYAELKARPVVRKWTVDELAAELEREERTGDVENGRRVFTIGQCFKCHRVAGQGGIVGPDLTPAGRRFALRDLLATLVEPNREISDQYRATTFELENGQVITGRIVNLNEDVYLVQTDMMNPGQLRRIRVSEIVEQVPSKVSMMPEGLLDTFTGDDIEDLVAFMRDAGEKALGNASEGQEGR
jgi:hypothetical protein